MFPIVFEVDNLDSNAKNNAFRILLKKGIECRAAVYAQELYESINTFASNQVCVDLFQVLSDGTEIEIDADISWGNS